MMKVIIETPEGIIWMRNAETGEGIASTGYVKDGTQQKIIAALEGALSQAKGEALCWDNVNGMPNSGGPSTNV
ncbi:Rrf2 family transcriptional regulator [Serratia nematodiphila]|uniref:Rrf2 family transcriptional regulator n=1 Tax=Serratia nematodiphila TaxID=458197 RepID=UPI0021C2F973|nr:Rrf2 family transcriptional regulator [Serratia nematodiphila]